MREENLMDAPTKALIDTIGDAGFDVQLRTDTGKAVRLLFQK